MAQYLLLDLDGTLIDSSKDLTAAMNRLLAEEGRAALSVPDLSAMVGDGVVALTGRAFAATGAVPAAEELHALTGRFLHVYQRHATEETVLYDGVKQTLSALADQNWHLGLASNKPQKPCEDVLAHFGIAPLFDVIVGGDTAPERKPHPSHLHYALQQMGAGVTAQGVMVGDHGNDVNAGKAAGLSTIAVDFGFSSIPVQDLGADQVITRFSDLPDALAAVTAKR